MKTPSEIVTVIGREALAAAVGVKPDAIRMALNAGRLPAAWYHACERLAGRPLPREAFSFKGARNDG
jgi:hypothetical protein